MGFRVWGLGVGVALAVAAFSSGAAANEERPARDSEIAAALARGAALRRQEKIVPGALQDYAIVTKIGGVPCGLARVTLEDGKGANGAAYKLSEQFKAAMTEGGEAALIDYQASYLLGADLGLLSAELHTQSEIKGAGGKSRVTLLNGTFTVKDDTLAWRISQQYQGEKLPALHEAKSLPLHGVRPLPRNALLALAAFARAREGAAFKPDVKQPACVPVFDVDYQMDNIDISPLWVTLDLPVYTLPKGTAYQVRSRMLAGAIGEKGLEVERPAPAEWHAVEVWAVNAQDAVLGAPVPADPRLSVEIVPPASLDFTQPFDLEKIAAAAKASAKQAR